MGIHDGKSENSSSLGLYCGGREPYAVVASTNDMFMVLKTDAGLQRKGFMATYSTGNYDELIEEMYPYQINEIDFVFQNAVAILEPLIVPRFSTRIHASDRVTTSATCTATGASKQIPRAA